MRVENGFQVTPFVEENPYTSDTVLPSLLRRILPSELLGEIENDLTRFGGEVITSIRALGSGNRVAPPRLIQYDQWGRRVDILETSEGWRDLKAAAQKEGIPAIFYERIYGEHSRVYGFAKVLLMVGDSHEVFCPLSMTDGTARVLELLGSDEMKKEFLPRLTSRDPSYAFTAGQWMTERPGGSDVSRTETVASPTNITNQLGSQYALNGFKWFSSATDSDIAVALARTGSVEQGSRALSLFLIPLRLPLLRSPTEPEPSPTSNRIFVHRLKNKIGTHTLPTAELSLEGTKAYLIGSLNQGVKNISPVLNITRVWSAMGSIGGLRKCLAIATAYSKVRAVQGGRTLLKDAPIHVSQLASLHILYRALTHLVFGAVQLLGKAECGVATVEELRRLRILTPTVKAFSAEKAPAAMEEAMTTLGGAGYMEENGFGQLIRDSLVEKIWEGTTTVLSLDIARAAQDPANVGALLTWARGIIASSPYVLSGQMKDALQLLKSGLNEIQTSYKLPIKPLVARPGLLLIGHVVSAIYLLEHATWSHSASQPGAYIDAEVFRRWTMEGGLAVALEDVEAARTATNDRIRFNSSLVYPNSKAKL
ncbi:hypothetical protein BDN72DRAFT_825377 [Pluteus cervinus]|uniref:Uncharacterized protein n=1 Tax=Pluteus cervinus TaxID=181527 RepID=A0ACD3AG47_9AGAR|nr:hypothetical protein BDN72DRAFT_825377 [Pluteus cervinus]